MGLTEADKKDFVHFVKGILSDSAETIASDGKPGIAFDTGGHLKINQEKHLKVEAEEAKETSLNEKKLKQTVATNAALDDSYATASATAEAIVSHLGEEHPLSKLIRQKWGGMHNADPVPGTDVLPPAQ